MALQIVINLTDDEVKIMEDMVVNIEDWFLQGPFREKIANHKKRIAEIEIRRLISEGAETVPTSIDALVQHYFDREDYKNRATLEAEQQQVEE